MGNIPEGDPVGQSTGMKIQEGRVPGFIASAITSLPTDPAQKRRIIASQLFPDLPLKDAESRIFPGDNDGRLAAVGKDGVPYFIEPKPSNTVSVGDVYSPASIASTFPRTDLISRAGSLVGPAMPAVGGVGGGAIAAPTSVVVGPLAAGAGAAVGDAARQGAARYFDPTPGATPYNYAQTGGEALGAAGGQLFGATFLKAFAPNRLGINLDDLPRDVLLNAENLNRLAQGMDITKLTPGMLSGAPSILASEDAIASGAAGRAGQDIGKTQYGGLRNELMDAFQKHVLDPISSASDKTDAALQFQQGAEDAGRIVRQQANAAAAPSYDAARGGGQVMSPDLAQLMNNPAVQDAMAAAGKDYRTITGKELPNTPDFDLWDLTKRKLDDTINMAKRAGDNTTAAAVDNVRQRLLANLDAAYPTYATARATSAPGIRLAGRLNDSTGAAVGTGTGTESAEGIVNKIFQNQSNPRSISEARDGFIQAGREDEWNAGLQSLHPQGVGMPASATAWTIRHRMGRSLEYFDDDALGVCAGAAAAPNQPRASSIKYSRTRAIRGLSPRHATDLSRPAARTNGTPARDLICKASLRMPASRRTASTRRRCGHNSGPRRRPGRRCRQRWTRKPSRASTTTCRY